MVRSCVMSAFANFNDDTLASEAVYELFYDSTNHRSIIYLIMSLFFGNFCILLVSLSPPQPHLLMRLFMKSLHDSTHHRSIIRLTCLRYTPSTYVKLQRLFMIYMIQHITVLSFSQLDVFRLQRLFMIFMIRPITVLSFRKAENRSHGWTLGVPSDLREDSFTCQIKGSGKRRDGTADTRVLVPDFASEAVYELFHDSTHHRSINFLILLKPQCLGFSYPSSLGKHSSHNSHHRIKPPLHDETQLQRLFMITINMIRNITVLSLSDTRYDATTLLTSLQQHVPTCPGLIMMNILRH
ncbi:uncharacterized protein CLUP02_06431 [Colletotrichum lupini]|uniref:Uncharacterized protein n=1 Tax=Colletotrichum lupini TaxID=145971 RepID=A0A9Q8WFQ1_9PEZI|nr:uncharacterized protein CLUP02_06431 [Colletotrichum lupini]UQC80945.1 hypothetical protein CLUP02_06431 [Colletotrichum lupini]